MSQILRCGTYSQTDMIKKDMHSREEVQWLRRVGEQLVVDEMECFRKVTWEMRLEKSIWP